MLYEYLELDLTSRKELIRTMTLDEKRSLFKSIPKLSKILNIDQTLSHDEKVKIRKSHIDKFPNGVFWDVGEYLDSQQAITIDENVLVSTRGDVILYNENIGLLYMKRYDDPSKGSGYRYLRLAGTSKSIHRTVATMYIPIPDELFKLDPKFIDVNHKDENKRNNHNFNLEWTSTVGNARHGKKYSDYVEYDHYLVEVIVDNGFLGRKFVITNHEQNSPITTRHLIGNHGKGCKRVSGFSVRNIDAESAKLYPLGFPGDIADLYRKDKRFFQQNCKPIIGTVMRGVHKGFKFSFLGKGDISKYFLHQNVVAAAKGKLREVCGCVFQYASHREAIPFVNKMTEEIKDSIKR